MSVTTVEIHCAECAWWKDGQCTQEMAIKGREEKNPNFVEPMATTLACVEYKDPKTVGEGELLTELRLNIENGVVQNERYLQELLRTCYNTIKEYERQLKVAKEAAWTGEGKE